MMMLLLYYYYCGSPQKGGVCIICSQLQNFELSEERIQNILVGDQDGQVTRYIVGTLGPGFSCAVLRTQQKITTVETIYGKIAISC